MADFNIQPVGTQIRPIQPMSLADMVQMARGVQAYQQAQQINPLELQQKQQATRTGEIALGVEEQKNKERLNMQQFFADPNNFQTDGRIDIDKINAAVPNIAPLTGSEYIKKYTELGKAQTEAISAKQNLTQDQRNMIASRFSVLGRLGIEDKNKYIKEMDLLKKENPDNKDLAKLIDAYKTTWKEIPSGPQLPGIAIAGAQSLLTPAQLQSLAPQVGTINTGEQIYPTVTTPSVGGMLPRIQMGTQPLADVGISPTTEVVDPVTGQRKLIGPASQRGQQQYLTNVGPAQAGTLEAAANVIKEDLPKTLSDAQAAPARIGIFQNIKKLTPDAFTGVTSERRQAVANLAQVLGIPAYQLESATTDELMKNTKLLQLAGGNTDAARALAEFANPNTKMTKEGITRVTDQLLGIEKMKLARSQYLGPAQNNATEYMQRKQAFDSISDPRLFQEMSDSDSQKMWNSLKDKEKSDLIKMFKQAKQMGVLQ